MAVGCKFQNLKLKDPTPFIQISLRGTASISDNYQLSLITFENISTKATLFSCKMCTKVAIDTLTMNNITKIYDKEIVEDTNNDSEWPDSICIKISNSLSITMKNSMFNNVSSHCLGLESVAAATLEKVVFNNTNLQYLSVQQADDSLGDSSGVSWVLINNKEGFESIKGDFIINQNKFIENTIYPQYGGVSFFFIICE